VVYLLKNGYGGDSGKDGEGMLMLLRVGILPVDMQIVLFNSDRQL
jgi:hypothetical protein